MLNIATISQAFKDVPLYLYSMLFYSGNGLTHSEDFQLGRGQKLVICDWTWQFVRIRVEFSVCDTTFCSP